MLGNTAGCGLTLQSRRARRCPAAQARALGELGRQPEDGADAAGHLNTSLFAVLFRSVCSHQPFVRIYLIFVSLRDCHCPFWVLIFGLLDHFTGQIGNCLGVHAGPGGPRRCECPGVGRVRCHALVKLFISERQVFDYTGDRSRRSRNEMDGAVELALWKTRSGLIFFFQESVSKLKGLIDTCVLLYTLAA